MKTLVVFYSRTGTTRKVAEKLSAALAADLEEIIDKDKRSGVLGYLRSGRDAIKKTQAKIELVKNDPAVYDLIIVGTPVWIGTMAAAVKTYLSANKDKIKKAAFFSTQGSSSDQRVFSEMEKVFGRSAVASQKFVAKEVWAGNADAAIENFASQLK